MRRFSIVMLLLSILAAATACSGSEAVVDGASAEGMSEEFSSAVRIDESNRDLIGTEIVGNPVTIYDSNEDPVRPITTDPWDTLVESGLIKRPNSSDIFPPSSVTEFITKDGVTPELLMTNGACAIFSLRGGEGWQGKAGAQLSFDFAVYPPNQALSVGYIKDGLMCAAEGFSDSSETYVLDIEESGIYQLYLIRFCSDYLSLKEGLISIS